MTASLGARIKAQVDAWAHFSAEDGRLIRTFLSPEHAQVADAVIAAMTAAGMSTRIDAIGNVVGRYEAETPGAPALLTGSHVDTVRDAGPYDGNLGVALPIACIAELHARGKRLPFAIEVIAFGDEEGVRFPTTLSGSHTIAGTFDTAMLAVCDTGGVTLEQALRAFGCQPENIPAEARRRSDVIGFIEIHIEQGPVLESEDLAVGIVTAISGASRFGVSVQGTAGHAGTVPMDARQDALAGAAEMILAIERRAGAHAALVATVGRMAVQPGAINVIPGRADFTVDIRAPEDSRRRQAVADVHAEVRAIAERRRLIVAIEEVHGEDAVACDPRLMQALEASVARCGHRVRRLPSGAGHDAMAIAALCPMAMLFIRCAGGISHNPGETVTAEDVDAAARVFLDFLEAGPPPASQGLSSMRDEHTAITTFLTGARQAQTRFLAELVKVPSDNPPGDCLAHAERAAALLQELGLTVERHPVPAAQVTQVGMVRAVNLVVRRRFGDGPVIALNTHGDVVPPGEGWTRDPYGAEIVDDWMYGRGVAVSKSDFATYAYALLALEKVAAAGMRLAGTVELHFTYDEESGGEIGPRWLIGEGICKPDLALGAGFSYAVVNAHNGCLHLEVRVEGRSAHAAMPATGVDALHAATHILSALYAGRESLAARVSDIPGIGSPQLTVGLIKGGINTNVVPDRVTFRLDRRMIPEEKAAEVEADVRARIAEAAAAVPEATVSVRRILLAEPLLPLDGGRRLADLLCAHASQVMGEPVVAKGVPLYTDARHYAAAGIPIVLYGAGPHTIQEANAHRADERLPLDDLYKATQVVALTLCDLLTEA